MKEGVKIADDQRWDGWRILKKNKVRAREKRQSEEQEESLPQHFEGVAQQPRKGTAPRRRKRGHCPHADQRVSGNFTFKAGSGKTEQGHRESFVGERQRVVAHPGRPTQVSQDDNVGRLAAAGHVLQIKSGKLISNRRYNNNHFLKIREELEDLFIKSLMENNIL